MAHIQPKFVAAIESMRNPKDDVMGVTTLNSGAGNPFEDDNDIPIFSKRKMVLRIPKNVSGEFMQIIVSKNWLVCLLFTTESEQAILLLRFFLPRAIPPGEITLDKYVSGYNITRLFLDHTGHHLLISLVPKCPGLSADFLYIHGNGPKIRRIEKFKDHEITAVAFNYDAPNNSNTGAILLGTSRGLIFETELLQDSDRPPYRKQLYDLGLGRSVYPINGLTVLRVPNSYKYFVVIAAPDSIYTFQETVKADERSLQSIFSLYVSGVKEPLCEEQKTNLHYSLLQFYTEPNKTFPKQWAWLCGAGIRVGEVSDEANSDVALLGDTLIKLDFKQHKHLSYEEKRLNVPKAFVITAYHALLLYPDHVSGICLLNEEVVYEEYFHEQMGKLLNIVRDASTGAIYIYTERAIFNYVITNEDRDIWRIYLEKGDYNLASMHAEGNIDHMDIVLTRRAEATFAEGKYEEAALYFADTKKTFEEICLKFMALEDKRPMIEYVNKRLSQLNENYKTNEERMKVLVIWLIDLYITQINMPMKDSQWREKWQTNYDEFMKKPHVLRCTQQEIDTVKQVIAQHADSHNLAQFAIANGDYKEVINQQLSAENYLKALQTLHTQNEPELFYKYVPILLEHLPKETVDVLIAQDHNINSEKLVPALIAIESPENVEYLLKYLEHAIYNLGTTVEALHNYLLRLYAEHKPNILISYLENQGRDESLVHYDINYALQVCIDFGVKEACVFLQCLLQLWVVAVDLALTFDLQLAKETASRSRSEEMRRKLWLRIASHEIEGTNDVKKALNLLKECDLLRIEDLLPFFSDFEKIDHFKDAICKALKDYNQLIKELQHDMSEYTKQADRVRNDLQNVRLRSIRIQAQDLCAICESCILVKPFFAFICGHKFHNDCLEKQVVPLLNSEESRRLSVLKQEMESLLTQAIITGNTSRQQQNKRDKTKAKIEEILASNCLYCNFLIDSIDQPFIDNWDQVNVDWE